MNELIEAACTFAKRGAQEYLMTHNLTADPANLSECLKSWVKLELPGAIHDAKQAIDCGMSQVAQATFTASMVNAGIQAAKECSVPVTA